jgi:hypothetical protein
MTWLGGVMGVAYAGLGFLAEREYADIAKFVIGGLWVAVGVMSYFMRERLSGFTPPVPPSTT